MDLNFKKYKKLVFKIRGDKMKNIVETAIGAGSFKTLVKAVKEAGLVEALSGSGPFTVFAPSDDAFSKIPRRDLENLLKDKKGLASVLKYHVVQGKLWASNVTKMTSVKTLQGGNLSIEITGGVRINDANVMQADIECSNGIIHVIDSVLMPALTA